MKVFFKLMEWMIVAPYKILKGIGLLFKKGSEIIKPQGFIEWLILLVAVPVPFGVTAFFIYKYFKQQ